MKKYIVCPKCNFKNPSSLFACAICDTDLHDVAPTVAEDRPAPAPTPVPVPAPAQPKVEVYPAFASPLEEGKAIAQEDASPAKEKTEVTIDAPEVEVTAEPKRLLISIDGDYTFEVSSVETLIGRALTMSEYLNDKPYVSRVHANLILEGGALYIENLSKTNFTYVNNCRIEEKTKLADGDEIGLGGIVADGSRQSEAAYFMVKFGATE